MKAVKIYNNNIVAVVSEQQEIALITGRGVGFNTKPGDEIALQPDWHLFLLVQPEKADLRALMERIDGDALEIARSLYQRAMQEMDYPVSTSLLLQLADHISFKIDMLKQGIIVPNLLMTEVKTFYPKEFAIGRIGVEQINQVFGTDLDDDEASYLAMHILNAAMSGKGNSAVKITEFIREMMKIINDAFGFTQQQNHWVFERLIIHLKFLGQRLSQTDESPKEPVYDGLLQIRETDLIKINEVIYRANTLSQQIFEQTLSANEQLYLSIHVLRIQQNQGEKYEKTME